MTMLANLTVTTATSAVNGSSYQLRDGTPESALIQANFTYGSGGTSADAYVQCSCDEGATWFDVANFHFTTSTAVRMFNLSALTPKTTQITPTNGSLAANTANDGLIGPLWRVQTTTVGTYAASTTLRVDVEPRGRFTV